MHLLLLLASLALTLVMSPRRDSREREPHLDCTPWDLNIKEVDMLEALNFILSNYQKMRDHENPTHTLGCAGERWGMCTPASRS